MGCRRAPPTIDVAEPAASASSSASSLPTVACSASCRVRVLATLRRSDHYALASDGAHLYYAAAYAASVARIPVEGGPRTILATVPPNKDLARAAITLTDKDVYWLHQTTRVFKVAKTGGAATEVLSHADSVRHYSFRAYDNELWFSSFTDPSKEFKELETTVRRLSGTTAAVVGKPYPLAIESVYTDNKSAFFVDESAHTLVEVPHATGKRATLARDLAPKSRVATFDPANVYLLEGAAIARVTRGNKPSKQTLATLSASTLNAQPDFLIDATDLWVLERKKLTRIPLSGGALSVHDEWGPSSRGYAEATLDGNAIYFDMFVAEGKTSNHLLVRVPK